VATAAHDLAAFNTIFGLAATLNPSSRLVPKREIHAEPSVFSRQQYRGRKRHRRKKQNAGSFMIQFHSLTALWSSLKAN
jgi:hypothetical protein